MKMKSDKKIVNFYEILDSAKKIFENVKN